MTRAIIAAFVVQVVLSAAVADCQPAGPSQVDESSFYQSLALGKGARAWGMGGVQIALPDGAASSSSNPAALAAVTGRSVSFSFSGDWLRGDLIRARFAVPQSGQTTTGSITRTLATASGTAIDFAGFSTPLAIRGHRFVVAASFNRQLTFGRETRTAYQFRNQSLYRFDYDYSSTVNGTGSFQNISGSLAARVAPRVTAGATLRYWFGGPSTTRTEAYQYSLGDYYGWSGEWSEAFANRVDFRVSGVSADVGIVVSPGDWLFAGLVYRTSLDATLRHANSASYRSDSTNESLSANHAGKGRLSLPASLGFGAAVRLWPRLVVSIDHLRTAWSTSRLSGFSQTTAQGGVSRPQTYLFPTMKSVSLSVDGIAAQSDTARTAAGAEYTFGGERALSLRGGAFYQQAYFDYRGPDIYQGTDAAPPTPGTTGITAGAGMCFRRMTLDVAWVGQRSPGSFVRHSVLTTLGVVF